jgi:hypothetical protein
VELELPSAEHTIDRYQNKPNDEVIQKATELHEELFKEK